MSHVGFGFNMAFNVVHFTRYMALDPTRIAKQKAANEHVETTREETIWSKLA